MDFELVPEGSLGQSAEHELGRGELDTEFYRGDEIEPKEFIREQLLLGTHGAGPQPGLQGALPGMRPPIETKRPAAAGSKN